MTRTSGEDSEPATIKALPEWNRSSVQCLWD